MGEKSRHSRAGLDNLREELLSGTNPRAVTGAGERKQQAGAKRPTLRKAMSYRDKKSKQTPTIPRSVSFDKSLTAVAEIPASESASAAQFFYSQEEIETFRAEAYMEKVYDSVKKQRPAAQRVEVEPLPFRIPQTNQLPVVSSSPAPAPPQRPRPIRSHSFSGRSRKAASSRGADGTNARNFALAA